MKTSKRRRPVSYVNSGVVCSSQIYLTAFFIRWLHTGFASQISPVANRFLGAEIITESKLLTTHAKHRKNTLSSSNMQLIVSTLIPHVSPRQVNLFPPSLALYHHPSCSRYISYIPIRTRIKERRYARRCANRQGGHKKSRGALKAATLIIRR